MNREAPNKGLTHNGLPFNRFGSGPKTAVVFPGLGFENKYATGMEARFTLGPYRCLGPDYTVYAVARRPGLAAGSSIADMAADYAEMISEELEPPVDVIGISTGGSVALQFAADHPGLLRRLVVHSAAYRLGPGGKQLQLEVRDLVREGKWRQACTALARSVLGSGWYWGPPAHAMGLMMATMAPDDPSDMITTIEAEDRFDLGPRLGDIQTPTLVMAGSADPFYTEELFRETAAGIPNGRLALYPGMGHPAKGPQFRRDLREFLGETP